MFVVGVYFALPRLGARAAAEPPNVMPHSHLIAQTFRFYEFRTRLPGREYQYIYKAIVLRPFLAFEEVLSSHPDGRVALNIRIVVGARWLEPETGAYFTNVVILQGRRDLSRLRRLLRAAGCEVERVPVTSEWAKIRIDAATERTIRDTTRRERWRKVWASVHSLLSFAKRRVHHSRVSGAA